MTTEIRYFTKEEALAAVIQRGTELQFCSPELQNDEEVVMASVNKNGEAFRYASDKFKSSKAFIISKINEGVDPLGLVLHANIAIQADIEVMTLAVEKSIDGWDFQFAKGEVALNKELAAKALVKWNFFNFLERCALWKKLHPTLQEFFPKESWYEKAKAYLIQLEQEKQAELVSGGSTTEDGVVW